MKNKFTIIWFGFLLFLLFCTFSLVSCKAKQPLQNTTVENTDKETVTETKETLTINREILDKMLFNIAQINSSNPDCDSLINYYRIELAKSLTAFKQSGDNSYELKYNEALKRLEFMAKIGKTENKELLKNTNTKTTYTLQKTIEVPVKMPLTWWEMFWIKSGQITLPIIGAFILFKLNNKLKLV